MKRITFTEDQMIVAACTFGIPFVEMIFKTRSEKGKLVLRVSLLKNIVKEFRAHHRHSKEEMVYNVPVEYHVATYLERLFYYKYKCEIKLPASGTPGTIKRFVELCRRE